MPIEDNRAPVHNGEGMRGLHVPGGSDTWREPPLKLVLAVTDDDIATGERGDPWDCPIARALDRTYGTGWDIGSASAIFGAAVYALGDQARAFIRVFDSGGIALPFTEDLELQGDG